MDVKRITGDGDGSTTDESQTSQTSQLEGIKPTNTVIKLAEKLRHFFEEKVKDEPKLQEMQKNDSLKKIGLGIIAVKTILRRINKYIPTINDELNKDIDQLKLPREKINMSNVADVITPLRKCVCTVSSSLMHYEFVDDIRTLMNEYNTIAANYNIIKYMGPMVSLLTSKSMVDLDSDRHDKFHVNSRINEVFVNKDPTLINLLDNAIKQILKLGSCVKTIHTPLITHEAYMSIKLEEKHAQPSDGNLYILDDWLKEIKFWFLKGGMENYARPIAYKKSDFTDLLSKYIREIRIDWKSDSDSTPKLCRDFVSILGYVEEDFYDAIVGLRKCKTTFCKIMHDQSSATFDAKNDICSGKSSGGKRTRKTLNPRVKIKTHNERNTKRAGKMYYAFGHSKRRS